MSVEGIEVVDKPEVIQEQPQDIGLSSQETELAKKHGLVDEPKQEVKQEQKPEEKIQSFEDTEKDESLLKNYNKNEQALYWKYKHDKKLRQEAQAERDLIVIREKTLKQELDQIKASSSTASEKLQKIATLLSGNPEQITIEALQDIINATVKKDDSNRPVTLKDLEELNKRQSQEQDLKTREQNKINQRILDAEEYAKNIDQNYDNVAAMAHEVLQGKIDLGVIDIESLQSKLNKTIQNEDIGFDEVYKVITGIAKLNPKFGKTINQAEKVLNNLNKQQTSASVQGGGGKRIVSYEDMTLKDVANLSTAEYMKIPKEHRERLLRS